MILRVGLRVVMFSTNAGTALWGLLIFHSDTTFISLINKVTYIVTLYILETLIVFCCMYLKIFRELWTLGWLSDNWDKCYYSVICHAMIPTFGEMLTVVHCTDHGFQRSHHFMWICGKRYFNPWNTDFEDAEIPSRNRSYQW